MENLFLKKACEKIGHDTFTENGALSNSTTGNDLVNQFFLCTSYVNRKIEDVFKDQELLWNENELMSIRFPFYIRMISRKTKVTNDFVTQKNQMGQGLRDESFKRLLWFAKYQPNIFYSNIWLLPIVGSWKDFWTLMYYDKLFELNVLDNTVIFEILKYGLVLKEHSELIKKFIPRIKTPSKCNTDRSRILRQISVDFCNHLGMKFYDYNKMKASGTSHEFQKLICSRNYNKLNWDLIPGKALSLISSSKFLTRHSLADNYSKWVMSKPIVNFNGYPYELLMNYRKNKTIHNKITTDKQFETLLERGRENGGIKGNVWCALDTSGSMACRYESMKKGLTPYDVCISLGIYFSSLNEGAFKDYTIMFDNVSRIKKLEGTFTEKADSFGIAWGSTNFQSVIDEIVRVRSTNPEIPLEDYPKTVLVISDMQFNPVGGNEKTNYEATKEKLYEKFPKEFVDDMKFIWWNCAARKTDFPATINDGGCYLLSGFDGSIVSLLLGGDEEEDTSKKEQKSMTDLVFEALSQEILLQVKLS